MAFDLKSPETHWCELPDFVFSHSISGKKGGLSPPFFTLWLLELVNQT